MWRFAVSVMPESLPPTRTRSRSSGLGGTPLPAVYDAAEVLDGLAVGGAACLSEVLGVDLWPVALALGDHADVEAGVEQLAGGELAERQNRAVERGVRTITSAWAASRRLADATARAAHRSLRPSCLPIAS